MQVYYEDGVILFKQHVSVTLQLVKPLRRLRMPASMRVIILTPVENCETQSIKVKFL